MRKSINGKCEICGHDCFKDWGYNQFHCEECGSEIGSKVPDYCKDFNPESSFNFSVKPSVSQICELLKTLSHDQQLMVIKRALDHYNCEDLCTGMALCLGPGKSEPLSQCEPTGSQLSKSLKTLDDNHSQVIMAENIDKSALDDDEDDGLCTRVTLVKAKSPSQCYREADWIWNMIQNRDQDKYLRMTKSALDRYKALKSLETLDGDHNQGDMVAREMQPCTAED